MRLRLMEVEGTPEEIGRLDVEHLLGHPLSQPPRIIEGGSDRLPVGYGPRAQLDAILDNEAPLGRSRELLGGFFDTVLSWGDVSVVPSWRPSNPSRVSYLRVHRHPRTSGAFVYVFPGRLKLNFRLDSSAAKGCQAAVAREVKSDNAYRVSLTLANENALEEARNLARQAYDTACLVPM